MHPLYIYYFTIKQTCREVIRSNAAGGYKLLCTYMQHLLSTSLSSFLYPYIFGLNATNSVMIFPPRTSFIMGIVSLFFPIGSDLLSCFEYSLVSNLASTSSAMLWKKSCLYLIHKADSVHSIVQLYPRKFYIKRNINKFDSIEIGHIVIAHLLPLWDLEKCTYTTLF